MTKTPEQRKEIIEERIKKIRKDKEFFESDISVERSEVYNEFLMEINETGSVRSETLLIFTFIESILKDIISLQLESKTARRISRDRIVEILEENEILNCYIGADIRKVFDIRDLYGHNLKKTVIEKEINNIINSMFTTEYLKDEFAENPKAKNFDERDLGIQLSDIGMKLINELQKVYTSVWLDSAFKKKNTLANVAKS